MKKAKQLLFFVPILFLGFSLLACSNGGTEEPTNIPVTGVSLDRETLGLKVGSTFQFTPTITPTNASNKNVVWTSSLEDIASISESGLVSALDVGETSVTVSTVDGGFTATCLVAVSEADVIVTGISLNYETVSLEVGDSIRLISTITPYNATNYEINWTSDNAECVEVSDAGVITAVAAGNANITATTVDGGYAATCAVTVSEKASSDDSLDIDTSDETVFVITEAGEYTLDKDYRMVYVEAPDAEVVLNMNGMTVENSENSPIYVADCDKLEIAATKNKTSNIKDTRAHYTEDVDGQGKGAIYVANGDLKLKATGTLNIEANYYNGIHGKDDVEIQKLTLNVTAVHQGIRGNDSLTINSGTINVSCGGDGLKTSNSDISSKGKQRGDITIIDGNITVNSWTDAVTAAHDLVVQGGTLNFNTNKYSSYDGDIVASSETSLYLKMTSNIYSNGNYTYAAYINGEWYRASYKGTETTQGSGPGRPGPGGWGGSTYYIYEIERPSSASSFVLYRFAGSNVTEFSTSSYNAKSESKAFNTNYDTISINSISGGTISLGSWSTYSSNGVSAKGLKADNVVTVSGGAITINSLDDGIHANNDNSLENGETPKGDVTITGGTITIKTGDDGVHADGTLSITDGVINVTESYEGLEGNVINVEGGESYVFATDDGMNASSGNLSPVINISGGLLDITVPSNGDTDGIDSNGTITITGGTTIVKGPGSAGSSGSPSSAIDSDGTLTISGGSLIVFGGIESTPRTSGVTKTLCSSSTVSTGSHTVSFTSGDSYSTNLKYSTSGCVVYSSLGSATLK